MAIKAALFDLDGTLLDSMGVWAHIDEQFLSVRGIPVPDDYQLAIAALRVHEAAAYTIRRFTLAETPEQVAREWMDMAREEFASRVALKPHARQLLELMRARGLRLGTVSSLAPELFEPALRRNGVYGLFDAFTSASEAPRSKAYPDAYLLAAGRLGAQPCECVMYDDLPEALMGARAAGMATVGVYDGHARVTAGELERAADRFIYDFKEEISRLENA